MIIDKKDVRDLAQLGFVTFESIWGPGQYLRSEILRNMTSQMSAICIVRTLHSGRVLLRQLLREQLSKHK